LVDGRGEIPFATASGKLLLRVERGLLRADINGDAKLDQADGDGTPLHGSLSVPVQLGDRSIPYQLKAEMIFGGMVVLASSTRLQGNVGNVPVVFVDTNVDGRFGQPGLDSYQVGSDGTCLRQGRTVQVGDALYHVEMTEDGGTVSTRPYGGPVATVTMAPAEPQWQVTLKLAHESHEMCAEVSSGEGCRLVPGSYQIEQATARFTKGATGVLAAARSERTPLLTLASGDNRIQAGPPFKLEFSAFCSKESPADVEIEDVALVGAAGERYRASVWWSSSGLLSFFTGKHKSRLECLVKQPEQVHRLSTMEYG